MQANTSSPQRSIVEMSALTSAVAARPSVRSQASTGFGCTNGRAVVGVTVGVAGPPVGVCVGGFGVCVPVVLGVAVTVSVGVAVTVSVGVAVTVGVSPGAGVRVTVGVRVDVGVGVRVGVGVGVRVGAVEVAAGVTVGVTVGQVNAEQLALQQAPSAALPLSHASPAWRTPSPQTGHTG